MIASIRLNFQSSLSLYLHIYSFLINPASQEWTEYPDSCCGICAYWYFAKSHYMWYIWSQGIKENLHIYWKQYEPKDSMLSSSHLISLLALFTNTPAMQILYNAWTKVRTRPNLLLPNVRDQYFGNISYCITVVIW